MQDEARELGAGKSNNMRTHGDRSSSRVAPRVVALLFAGGCAVCAAQDSRSSTLPASAPTSAISPSQLRSANPPAPKLSQGQADIFWDGNMLQVVASGMGLNRLLRDLAGKTNLQITGTAPEERIFGTYGPGRLEDVLSDLLDGLQVNVMFVDRPGGQTKQLMLTARTGGPSLPTQQQAMDSEQAGNQPPQVDASQRPPVPFTPPPPPSDPGASAAEPSTGVRTPEQIFQQLQRLRQQANAPK